MHTSINSLLAPSEMVARPSYLSGSKSFRAEVRYSPAGVVLAFSGPALTKAVLPSILLVVEKGAASAERPLPELSFLGAKKGSRRS